MSKPSIFSKDYERHMKKRKRRIFLAIVLIIVLVICLYLYIKGKQNILYNFFNNKNINTMVAEKANKSKNENSKNITVHNVESGNEKLDVKKNSFIVNINNKKIKVSYEIKKDKKIIKDAVYVNNNSKVYYDISPSKNCILVYDVNTQDMFLADTNKNVSDITKQEYISSKGQTFKKDDKLTADKGYVWCTSPKFIDDETIAFISELPWFNSQGKKYIWYGNVKSKTYNYIINSQSNYLEFHSITDKGLEVKIDNNIYYLDSQGILKNIK